MLPLEKTPPALGAVHCGQSECVSTHATVHAPHSDGHSESMDAGLAGHSCSPQRRHCCWLRFSHLATGPELLPSPHRSHERGHSFIMKPGFFRQSPAAAHCGQSFSLSRHMLVHTPHETGHVDRIAGFCEHTASKEDERRRCGAGRAGRASSHGSHLDALAIPRPPAAFLWLLVVALDLANSARGGTRLEHVPRVRLALPVLCPIGARLLDVTAEQRAVAARMDALLLHKLLVLAIALAVLGPRAARRVVVVAQAPARHTANREQREGEKPHHLSRHRQNTQAVSKVCVSVSKVWALRTFYSEASAIWTPTHF